MHKRLSKMLWTRTKWLF